MKRTRIYFQSKSHSCFYRIEDDTVNDLHLDEVFELLNHTESAIGEQYLYKMIRCVPERSELADYEEWINQFAKNEKLQTCLGKELSKLKNSEAYYVYPLVSEHYVPFGQRSVYLFRLLQLLPVFFLGLLFITNHGFFLIALLTAFLGNLVIHYRSKMISFSYSGSIPQLFRLLRITDKLVKIPDFRMIRANIVQVVTSLSELKRKLSVFRFDAKMDSDILAVLGVIKEIISIFFLVEPIRLNTLFSLINRNRKELEAVFAFIGFLDVLQSVAKARSLLPYFSTPDLTETTTVSAADMYHPLIQNCVSNSFSMPDKSFLVLGSNMSGKTSFTRMIGVNTIIAQTLNICFAKSFSCNRYKVHTILSVNDNLLEGESYYLSEVLRMKKIIEDSGTGSHLILLDELFKGTNTIERISVAKAVLAHLAENGRNRIIVATHDFELVKLLPSTYRPVYFTENIMDNRLSFNYKLSLNPNQQRNAIRILEVYNYPEKIVEEALRTSANFSAEKKS